MSKKWGKFASTVAKRLKRAIKEWCESPYHTADNEADCFYSLNSVPVIPDLMEMFRNEAGFTEEEIRLAMQMPEKYKQKLDSEITLFLSTMGETWEARLRKMGVIEGEEEEF